MKKFVNILLAVAIFFSIALIAIKLIGTYIAPGVQNLSLSGTCISFDTSSITLQIENNAYIVAIGSETQVRVESKFIIPPALKNFQSIDKFQKDLFTGHILQIEAKKYPDSLLPIAQRIIVIEPFTSSPIQNNDSGTTPIAPRNLPTLPADSAILE